MFLTSVSWFASSFIFSVLRDFLFFVCYMHIKPFEQCFIALIFLFLNSLWLAVIRGESSLDWVLPF